MTATAIGGRVVAGCVLSLVLVGLLATPAAAHTKLASSSPAGGAVVTNLTRIDLRFTESIEVAASHVWISDSAGYLELAGLGSIDGDRASLTVPVPALGEGDYEVTWHVVAADGDPVQGTFRVTLAPAPVAATQAGPLDPAADFPPDTSLAISLDSVRGVGAPPDLGGHGHGAGDVTRGLARGLLDTALAILVGGLGFVVLVWPKGAGLRRTRQVLWGAAGAAAIASLELTAFQHAGATGTSTLAALTPTQLLGSLDFHFGRVAAVRLGLLLASVVLVALLVRSTRPGSTTPVVPGRWWALGAGVLALGLSETLVLVGQSSALSVTGIARLTHVVGISAWLGGLVMLVAVALPRRRPAELLAVLPRFSRFATAAIGTLMVGGVLLAVDHLGSIGALTSSDYGRVLLAKLVVVGVLLLAAARSRDHVRALLHRSADSLPPRSAGTAMARPLLLWAGVEVGLLAAVLALTAVLVARVPPG